MNKLASTLLLVFFSNLAGAQISPQPGSSLNYTQIMFEHDKIHGASEYLIEVKRIDGNDSTFSFPTYSQKDSSTATIISNFEFGKRYKWRYSGLHNGKKLEWHGPYSFEISKNLHVNKNFYRARVLQNDSSENAGGLIVMDMGHSIIDRNGNFVWYLPQDTENIQTAIVSSSHEIMTDDMRISPFGTITYIIAGRAEERDLNGHLLWEAPLNDSARESSHNGHQYHYHHCFQRLMSGNYMVLDRDSILIHTDSGDVVVEDEIIKEFNKNKNLVWSWSSEYYFDSAEINHIIHIKSDSGLVDPTPGGHLNAFCADEINGYIYAGFRNVSRIIKIEKKTGKVIATWGAGMKDGDGFFSKQHDANLLRDGSIVVFSNGDREPPVGIAPSQYSSVVNFTQPSDNRNSQMIWKFDCTFDSVNYQSLRGGDVDELKNGNLLVCMGAVNRVFEITRSKKIVWSAVIQKKERRDEGWRRFPLNRAHYTSSLYPYYFTIQSDRDTISRDDNTFKLKIFNDGTEDDSYEIRIKSTTGNEKTIITLLISSHSSMTFDIPTDSIPKENDKIMVNVRSRINSDLTRTLSIQSDRR